MPERSLISTLPLATCSAGAPPSPHRPIGCRPATSPRAAAPTSLHIFRAGSYTDMHGREIVITPEELVSAAEAYDPALYQAPIVVGHPKDNSPAFGWLAGLSVSGADLEGEPVQVDPAFAEAVRAGRYKHRSASFWPPEHPGNPRPGVWYLRHVGFLGGAPPAVKGLRGADLADAPAAITIDFTEDQAMPNTDIHPPAHQPPTTDLAEREQAVASQAEAIAAREAAIAERERRVAEQDAAIRRREVTGFAEGLAEQARLRPGDVPRVVEVLLALDEARPEPLPAFAETDGTEQAAAVWLRGWLAALPPLVELSEVATRERAAGGAATAEFAAPPGYQVPAGETALFARASAYAQEKNIPFIEAYKAVGGQ